MIEISGVRTESLGDGIGIRTVIFFQGCKHHCYKCQNPETQTKGKGNNVSLQYLLNIIDNDKLAIGVTFSGGCPMCFPEQVIELAKIIKERNKNIWCYCGEKIEELKDKQLELLKYIDVIVDGRYMDNLRDDTLAFRGSLNQKILYKGKDY
jgi:anaerobic ribonucleoside-triphosphate reductase activating protein